MKLIDLFEETLGKIRLFHAAKSSFKKFNPRPTWFSTNEKDAKGWHKTQEHDTANKTYVCEFQGGNIATEKDAAKIAKKIWPRTTFLYSMFDESIGEYDVKDIKRFILELEKAGYVGAWIDDYDPNNFEEGSSRSLCIFNPAKSVKIVGEHKFNVKEEDSRKPLEPMWTKEESKTCLLALFLLLKNTRVVLTMVNGAKNTGIVNDWLHIIPEGGMLRLRYTDRKSEDESKYGDEPLTRIAKIDFNKFEVIHNLLEYIKRIHGTGRTNENVKACLIKLGLDKDPEIRKIEKYL